MDKKSYAEEYYDLNKDYYNNKKREKYATDEAYREKCKEYRDANKEKAKEYKRKYYIENKEKINKKNSANYHKNKHKRKSKAKTYRQSNKQKIALSNKQYRDNNKEKIAKYFRDRINNDPVFKLQRTLRVRLNVILKQKNAKKTNQSHIKFLGCSLNELRLYLESKFKDGMTWNNHSRNGWHIDHIIPMSSFDLTNPEEVKIACHYLNLRPEFASENIKKRDKMPKNAKSLRNKIIAEISKTNALLEKNK